MRRRSPRTPVVPASLVDEIARSLAEVDRALASLESMLRRPAALAERRAARAAVGAAFAEADRLLRRAAALTRPGPYHEWRRWRHRLSQLDLAKQRHLFAESDDVACLGMGSVQVVDTGMEKPHIGELAYGHSREPGAPARYGLDMAAALGTAQAPRKPEPRDVERESPSLPAAA
jgi:hypothetical protein